MTTTIDDPSTSTTSNKPFVSAVGANRVVRPLGVNATAVTSQKPTTTLVGDEYAVRDALTTGVASASTY
jgi:hypothetical protein